MQIIIAPAKKMKTDTDIMPWRALPRFLSRTETILKALREMDAQALKTLWKCNDQIAALNIQRLGEMDLRRRLTPAVFSYEGIQYQYMAPDVFTEEEYEYIQAHLYILSGFYGLLRPFDGVTPYRLEMQAKLRADGKKDLYAFWNGAIADALCEDDDCIVNLASKEYSLCVYRHLKPHIRWITCVFGEEKDGKIVEKGTLCKMARGEMVRFLAQGKIERPDEMKRFSRLGYCFAPARSDEETYVFVRQPDL